LVYFSPLFLGGRKTLYPESFDAFDEKCSGNRVPILAINGRSGGFIKIFPAKRQVIERQRTVYVAATQVIQIGLIWVDFALGIVSFIKCLWAKTQEQC
jgi:hypothetical protein